VRSRQNTEHVPAFYAKDTDDAKRACHAYVENGIRQGKREELSGGGFIRSPGGWSEIKDKRRPTDTGCP
jgi:hypothetical protein